MNREIDHIRLAQPGKIDHIESAWTFGTSAVRVVREAESESIRLFRCCPVARSAGRLFAYFSTRKESDDATDCCIAFDRGLVDVESGRRPMRGSG
jgi:hypothetical protein